MLKRGLSFYLLRTKKVDSPISNPIQDSFKSTNWTSAISRLWISLLEEKATRLFEIDSLAEFLVSLVKTEASIL